VHLAYIWIVSHLYAKNCQNWWKFDEVLTKTNLLSFFWDTVYKLSFAQFFFYFVIIRTRSSATAKSTARPSCIEITQNNGHYAVQGHSMSQILVLIESQYATS